MIEEKSKCIKCGKEDYLGDGLCQKCWDRKIGKNRYKVILPEYNIDGTKVKNQRCYIAKVKCMDCGIMIDAPTLVGRRPAKTKRCRPCNQLRWVSYMQKKAERCEKGS